MEGHVSEHSTSVYDNQSSLPSYATASSSSGSLVQAMYADYGSDWHTAPVDPTRATPEYPTYMGYTHVAQGDLVTNGAYWPGEIGMHPSLPYNPYAHPESMQGLDFSQHSPQSLGKNGKPKRKRVQTVTQRRAANIRERRRMFHLNEAFDDLRKRLPAFNYEKRLSRIETLRLAITYISFMKDISDGEDPKNVKLKTHKSSDILYPELSENMNSDDSLSS
ncbi:hypothetical protein FSP39_000411 [Pinctada imbricata]|uniref:BHLH domain-containing protein n=1 Tax=Pinctada imbricata TaxID=66713 RepID=A0AA88YKL2_PINIB|nr:hypothetical protein FSP39_000411 [Pinctada imbricata]